MRLNFLKKLTIKPSDLVLNTNLVYLFNPFSGLQAREIAAAIVMRPFTETILKKIRTNQTQIIELIGAQGRGKTTHLKYLQQQFPQYPLFLLDRKSSFETVLQHQAPVVFVDSIHHFSIYQRLRLYRLKKQLILTTHCRRSLEYYIARKAYSSYGFKGIDIQVLKSIIQKRIAIATNKKHSTIVLNEKILKQLIKHYKDDYRGILNYLYDQF